jgi:hypothetical protein
VLFYHSAMAALASRDRWHLIALYFVMIVGTVAGFLLIRHAGRDLAAPLIPDAPLVGRSRAQVDTLLHILLALAVIIGLARVVGLFFRYLHQPPVIGEVLAGSSS